MPSLVKIIRYNTSKSQKEPAYKGRYCPLLLCAQNSGYLFTVNPIPPIKPIA